MQQILYKIPKLNEGSFHCPLCNAFSHQSWFNLSYDGNWLPNLKICLCSHCNMFSIWYNGMMIYPNYSGIELPNQDLNDDIKNDYEEAAEILQKSPRGSAALLRLAIQKLCIQLGEGGKDLNIDIGNLVKSGLPIKVQEALDSLRVIGNEAVHPGEMDLKDDIETASSLFKLINFIAEKLITEPKEIDDIYNKLPVTKIEQISKRDKINSD